MKSGIDHFGYHTLYGDASNIPLCCNIFFTGSWIDGLDDFFVDETCDTPYIFSRVKGSGYIQCPDCIAKCVSGDKKPNKLIKDDRIHNLKEIRKVYRKETFINRKS